MSSCRGVLARNRSRCPLCVIALASVCGCVGLRVWLLRPPRANASASACGCFSLRVRLLQPPRAVASAPARGYLGDRMELL